MTQTPPITFVTNASLVEAYVNTLLLVLLAIMTVGLLIAIIRDFRAPAGTKTRSGLIVTGSFALGALLGVAAGMGAVHGVKTNHVADTCAAFEEMYQSGFEDCGELDIPLFEPETGVFQTYGETEAIVEFQGQTARIPVTLVWDGETLLLADSAALRGEDTHEHHEGDGHDH